MLYYNGVQLSKLQLISQLLLKMFVNVLVLLISSVWFSANAAKPRASPSGSFRKTNETNSWSNKNENSDILGILKIFSEQTLFNLFVRSHINRESLFDEFQQYRSMPIILNWLHPDDSGALVKLLYYWGYLSLANYEGEIGNYPNFRVIYTLKFPNLSMKTHYAHCLYNMLTHQDPTTLHDFTGSMIKVLQKHKWKSFIDMVDIFFNRTSQIKNFKSSFHMPLYLQLSIHKFLNSQYNLTMEKSTNKWQADFVFSTEKTIFIFLLQIPYRSKKNLVYHCKEKYSQKYLLDSNKTVACIGLKISTKGAIKSWGVAHFSTEGKLLGEEGNIRLSTSESSDEQEPS